MNDDLSVPPAALITFLYVTDLEASERFYVDRLGMSVAVRQEVCCILRVVNGAFLGLCTHRPPTPPGAVMVTLVRDDVEDYCAQLAAAGVVIDEGPVHNDRFGITQAFLRDPDGNVVEIQRFDDPTWADADT